MNIQDYISSGIIESYVLGLASAEDRREFEKLCEQHVEIMQARIAFEESLEKQAMENQVAPPASVRNALMEKLFSSTPVVPMRTRTQWGKYAAAVAVVLLAASVYWNISLYQKNRQLNKEYEEQIAKLTDMEKDMHVLQNPSIKMTSMKGLGISPRSYATVYWDTTSHDVYLLVNNLPQPASDKQYQLWAIIDSKPVDLGVFDLRKEKLLIQAKNAQNVQAFAITLEKKGGSPSGPQGDMYVMGKP